ncbi:nuclear transport factor 2 family protein [Nocardioides ferulae]|uniref:nuclear transport factor 2 family protein n=1 Tax=Nocardioides ferulae TaxID=2340821 RepID=UPI000EB41992|nr:nuclear transport factor 2 family protein [Nocardioides ferulae]
MSTEKPTESAGTTATAVSRYLRFWNCDPGPDQTALAATVFHDDVHYLAPLGEWRGVPHLLELSARFAEHLGDVAFIARREPEVLRDRARLRWEIVRGDDSFAEGTDLITVDQDGRIAEVITFLDRAPVGAEAHPQAGGRA